jgi:cation diffusion facilitator family transporter
MDSASNVAGLIASSIAARPPDEDHPYGHRRYETLAALMIGALLLLTAWEVATSALDRLQHSEELTLSPVVFAVLIATVVVNLVVSRYERREGQRLKSELLLADAENTGTDVFVTLSVLASTGIVALTGWSWVDLLAALVVVALIGRAAWTIIRQTGGVLVDTAPYSPDELASLVTQLPSVDRVARARSRGPADAAHIDIDVQVAPEMTATQANAITSAIRDHLDASLDGVAEVEVHFVPDEQAGDDYTLTARAAAFALGLSVHEVHVRQRGSGRVLDLHVEVTPGQTLDAAHAQATQLEHDLKARLLDVEEVVTHIEPQQTDATPGAEPRADHMAQLIERALALLRSTYPDADWHQPRLYTDGDALILTLHAGLAAGVTIEHAHDLAEAAETLLKTRLPALRRVTIHTEPVSR